MLESYFVRPQTVDRIRALWLGPAIEQYVAWFTERRNAPSHVRSCVTTLERFNTFAHGQGARAWEDLPAHVGAFVEHELQERGACGRSAKVRRTMLSQARSPIEQRAVMSGSVRNPVVVITGASAGIGRAVARAFAQRGASLGLLARGQDGLDAARLEAEAAGVRAVAIRTDVADAGQVESAAAEIEQELGPIDIWINNATVSVFSPILQMTAEEFDRVTRVTYLGAVYGTVAALHRMVPRDRGVIVQVGSALAYRAIPLQSAYCAAKHALNGFTESLRSELLHDGSHVHVTMVHLPAVNTPQFDWSRTRMPGQPQPVPPIFQPEVAAEAIVWATGQRQREVWVGWPTVQAVVGDKLAPGLLDQYLARFGYESQQTDQPVAPDRQDNLFDPVPGDHGAHGRFDERAKTFSSQFWLSRHRRVIAGVAAAVALVAWPLVRGSGRRRAA